MRKLTIEEIETFAKRKGVRRIAIENFLMSMGTNLFNALMNLELDASLYKWNRKTYKAILNGIRLAEKGDK